MLRPILYLLLIASSQLAFANCRDLYRAEDKRLTQKFGETRQVGSQWSVSGGQIQYFPGWDMRLPYDTWVDTFLGAIESGDPYHVAKVEEKKLLKKLKKNIFEVCPLADNEDTGIRLILKELLEDQSFCPDGKILKHGFFNGWKAFNEVIVHAIQSGRFQDVCSSSVRINQSGREIQNKHDGVLDSSKAKDRPSPSAGRQ